jgi:hypothetical protein
MSNIQKFKTKLTLVLKKNMKRRCIESSKLSNDTKISNFREAFRQSAGVFLGDKLFRFGTLMPSANLGEMYHCILAANRLANTVI